MPCRMDDMPSPPVQLNPPMKFRDYREECDKLTAMLCKLCGGMKDSDLPDDVRKWWRKHKKTDRQRIAKEIEAARSRLQARLQESGKLQSEAAQIEKELNSLLAEQRKIINRRGGADHEDSGRTPSK